MTDGPPVTVSGGPAAPGVPERPARATVPLLAAGGVVLAGALVVAELLSPAAPPPTPVDASLALAGRDVVASRSGVLVVPVEVDNRGPAVQVVDPGVRAAPVGQEPATGGRTRIPAAGTGRVVVLVQPDCAALTPAGLAVDLVVTLRTAERAERTFEVDVGSDPAVRQVVAGVCSG